MPLSLLLTLQLQTICKIFLPPLLAIRYIFKPKRSTSSKTREQSVSDEEHSTALRLGIPTTNRTGRMIRRPAWHYDYDFSTDENCNFTRLLWLSMAMFHLIMRKQFCQLMLKNSKLQCKWNSKIL